MTANAPEEDLDAAATSARSTRRVGRQSPMSSTDAPRTDQPVQRGTDDYERGMSRV